jgi:N-acetylmuramoyl-L-alanine amidase
VRDLQRRLSALGHSCGDDRAGHYGAGTEQAVARFQQAAGLDSDGRCHQVTWSALVEAGYKLGDRQLYLRSPMMRGDDIVELQRCLSALGFHARRVDGIFGPDTASALAEFQRNTALPSDGIFGPESLAALQRLGRARVGALGVASVREREQLRPTNAALSTRRLVVGEPGGLGATAAAVSRALRDAGPTTVSVEHPDWSQHAREANALGAHLYLGLRLHREPGITAAFFAVPGFASAGGRYLAELLAQSAGMALGCPVHATGMRLPVLRETRMPAVLVAVGPPRWVVEHTAPLAECLARTVLHWLEGTPQDGDRIDLSGTGAGRADLSTSSSR